MHCAPTWLEHMLQPTHRAFNLTPLRPWGLNPPYPLPERVRDKFTKGGIGRGHLDSCLRSNDMKKGDPTGRPYVTGLGSATGSEGTGTNPPCPLPERVRDRFRKGGIGRVTLAPTFLLAGVVVPVLNEGYTSSIKDKECKHGTTGRHKGCRPVA